MQRQRAEGPPLAAAILSVGKERSSAESSGVLVRGHPATDVQTVETVSLSNTHGGGNAEPLMSQTTAGVLQTLLKII